MNNNSYKYTAWEIRQLDYISQFSTSLRHVEMMDNTVADILLGTRIKTLEDDILNQDLLADEENIYITRCHPSYFEVL